MKPSSRELEILQTLVSRCGKAVSRIRGTSDDVEVSARTVNQHIASLCRKLEADPSSPRLIETVYGFGYRLNYY